MSWFVSGREGPHLVVGFGITGAAVAEALVRRGEAVVVVDDRPGDDAVARATELGVELVAAPDRATLGRLVAGASEVLPAPGLPARHPVFEIAAAEGTPVASEFDLAARWDDRPLLAITGTDGKTTVTMLTCAMLEASGLAAQAVGNTPVPLVAAIDDPTIDVFVVEASSFRLDHSRHFAPAVATWLNFAPDHLDNHRSLAEYEAAKARIWRDQRPDDVAIGNLDDPVVARHLASAPARKVGFGLGTTAGGHGAAGRQLVGYRVADGALVDPGGETLARVGELQRSFPHDLSNGLAAAATALAGGATREGVRAALLAFSGLPHRVTLVGEAGGVPFYDDSKATTPHAVLAAVEGFESVVLICGGRNKGLDLSPLAEVAPRARAVVAIGDATADVAAVFGPTGVPVRAAESMDDAVRLAAGAARPGDAVLLSPGCASFDWYGSYGERGDDFARAVQAHIGGIGGEGGP